MESSVVVDRFGLSADVGEWLEEAERLPAPGRPLCVPVGDEAARVLDLFALEGRDREEVEALWPGDAGGGRGGSPGAWSAELWHVVECMYRRLWADAELPVGRFRWWPSLVDVSDVRLRVASLWAFAAMVAVQLEVQGRWGVPRSVTVGTLADVGAQVRRSRVMWGWLSLETSGWVALQFRGGLFRVGGLQLEPARLVSESGVEWYGEAEAAGLGEGMGVGGPVLRLHIPTGGLDPAGVDESLGRARAFARGCLGFDPVVATCTSWLLDPQWGEVLGEGSNIVAFQRRFTLVGEGRAGESDVFRFVFGSPVVDVERVPRGTRLERAVVDRLVAGGRWWVRTGWVRLS